MIANNIFNILSDFPKHERYDLSSQISCCSLSIPSNIVEKSTRINKSFSNFIDYPLGFSFELTIQLIGAKRKKHITEKHLIK